MNLYICTQFAFRVFAGPRGFGVAVSGAPSSPGSLGPRGGLVQPRPLMDLLGQYNGKPAVYQDQVLYVDVRLVKGL